MVIFHTTEHLDDYRRWKGQPIGFVPTMGALHAGHRSLLAKARQDGYLTVVSIFVNPTQFNDPEDFRMYPTSLGADIQLLEEAGCDVLFLPSVDEVYPAGTSNTPAFDFGPLESVLEGAKRPGHFKGVGQVVARLLEMVQPQALYLGKKDYQQCLVITDLVRQMGLGERLKVVLCPTVREPDGLALSSRNRRLTDPQRALAGTIYQCLVQIQTKKGSTSFGVVQKECEDLLRNRGFEPEYVSLADAERLEVLDQYIDTRPTVALIAAKIGGVRLIDNVVLE